MTPDDTIWTDADLESEDARYSWLYARGYGEGPVQRLLTFGPEFQGCGRVLDAGCGRQGFARAMRERGFAGQVVGVDVSRHVVESADGSCEVRHASLDALPFPDGSFDGLFCCDALEHLSADRLTPALTELSRVLAPGGIWAISVGTQPSRCRGPSGEDLHQIVEDEDWWHQRLAGTPLARPLRSRTVDRGALFRGLRGGTPLRFSDWLRATGWDHDRWLLLGKGPSFARLQRVETRGYRVLGLNHTVREAHVDVAHAIDLDVVLDLEESLVEQADYVVLPWHPHVDFSAGVKTLAEHAQEVPVLESLAQQGRLLTYDLGSWSGPHRDGAALVPGGAFSGDVVVRLLAEQGVRTIHTIGIDGGDAYAEAFSDLTPLTNGQRSFDAQTRAIERTVSSHDLDFGPCPDRARLTIVLVTWNAKTHVEELLAGIRAYTRSPYELVIVDNASSDGTRDLLEALPPSPGLTLRFNEENCRCAEATNQALELCRTEYVIYLCASHAVVTEPGWEEPLVELLDAQPQIDFAGDVWNPGFTLASRRYARGWTPEDHGLEHLLHVQGGIWIARRSLFDEVGPFAQDDYPHSGMDVEFSYRLLSLGRRLGHCPAVTCPAWPSLPRRLPGVVAYHPAPPALRAELRRELGLPTLKANQAAIVFCERGAPDSVNVAIVRALSAYFEVRPCGPGWPDPGLASIDWSGAGLFLELDSSAGGRVRPDRAALQGLRRRGVPTFAWLFHTHAKPGDHVEVAREVDLTFYASKAWAHVFPRGAKWLPIHSDDETFRPQEAQRRYDIVCAHEAEAWRMEPIQRVADRHGLQLHVEPPSTTSSRREAATLYAQASLIFHRHEPSALDFAVVEAMASGRVLLTDAQDNGQYELFEDARHYVLYKDEADLERMVLHYLGHGEARERIEREAAAHVARRHTTTVRVAQLVRAIQAFRGRTTSVGSP